MWYDLDSTMIIVDWAQGSAVHNYAESFNLQTEGNADNVVAAPDELSIRTRTPAAGT